MSKVSQSALAPRSTEPSAYFRSYVNISLAVAGAASICAHKANSMHRACSGSLYVKEKGYGGGVECCIDLCQTALEIHKV